MGDFAPRPRVVDISAAEVEKKYKFPEIRDEKELMMIASEGFRLVGRVRSKLDEKKKEFITGGSFFQTLGYLSRLFGGQDQFAGKRIVEVAGGAPRLPGPYFVNSSFNGSQARILSELGVEVTAVDPALKQVSFDGEGFDNIKSVGQKIEDFARLVEEGKIDFQKGDALISTAFLGGPAFSNLDLHGPHGKDKQNFLKLMRDMSKLAGCQIHFSQESEIDLDTINTAELEAAGVGKVIYNFDVSRSKARSTRDANGVGDFLIIESTAK